MKAYFNGQEVYLKLNGKRITFYFDILYTDNQLITADNKLFATADGKSFILKGV